MAGQLHENEVQSSRVSTNSGTEKSNHNTNIAKNPNEKVNLTSPQDKGSEIVPSESDKINQVPPDKPTPQTQENTSKGPVTLTSLQDKGSEIVPSKSDKIYQVPPDKPTPQIQEKASKDPVTLTSPLDTGSELVPSKSDKTNQVLRDNSTTQSQEKSANDPVGTSTKVSAPTNLTIGEDSPNEGERSSDELAATNSKARVSSNLAISHASFKAKAQIASTPALPKTRSDIGSDKSLDEASSSKQNRENPQKSTWTSVLPVEANAKTGHGRDKRPPVIPHSKPQGSTGSRPSLPIKPPIVNKNKSTKVQEPVLRHRLFQDQERDKMQLPIGSAKLDGTPSGKTVPERPMALIDPEKPKNKFVRVKPKKTVVTEMPKKPVVPERPKNLMEITLQTGGGQRNMHKLMLFRLFLQSDKAQLDVLANNTDEKALGVTKKSWNPESSHKIANSVRKRASVISLLPAALQEFRDAVKGADDSVHVDILGDAKRRKGFSSRSLLELESLVHSKFLESDVYKAARRAVGPNEVFRQQSLGRGDVVASRDRIFSPFSLEYNECSVTALARWATNEKEEEKAESKGPKKKPIDLAICDRPTVPSLFQKCQVCGAYGHYEIECNKMTEDDAIELAHQTMVHANVRELVEKRRDKSDLLFRHLGFDKSLLEDDAPTDEPEEDFSRKYFACEVCCCGLDDDHMLICDGCDKLYHLYCLNPPLKKVPEDDWFCKTCVEYNNDVSSDVEIEVCEEYVIEQRKRPLKKELSKEKGKDGLPCNDWQTAVAVIREEPHPSMSSSEETRGKRRRTPVVAEEQTEIDGFFVHAKSTSDSPRTLKRMKLWANQVEDLSREDLVPGSVVTWLPPEYDDGTKDSSPLVGNVLAVDASSGKALVRGISEWKEVLVDHDSDEMDETPKRLEECSIRAVTSGSTFWYPAEELYIVARAASKDVTERFRNEVLPSRVKMEQKRHPQYAAAGTLLSTVVD
jgi:hypothetical protein